MMPTTPSGTLTRAIRNPLGQVHSALAYYYDHKDQMDREIEDRHERATRLRAGAGESPGRRKLRERGLLP